jgi:hypothetical protein
MNETVQEILKGSIDLHVHAGPEPGRERRMDALETARHAYEAEMGGFVLKSHQYPTAPLADLLGRVYPGLKVHGAIVLNRAVGGLNPDAVQVSAALGARVVWMPTFDSHFAMQRQGLGPGIRMTDESGALAAEVNDILDIASKEDMVLASGHISPAETITLFTEARSRGVRRMVVTHPAEVASPDELKTMVSLGAFPEFTFLSATPSSAKTTPKKMADAIKALGVQHCVVTTDFGQWMNPSPAEGMRMAIAELLHAGLTPDEVSTLVKGNPSQLLDRD